MRDAVRRGRIVRLAGASPARTCVVDLARHGEVGPLLLPLAHQDDVLVGTVTYALGARVGDTVVVADVGAVADTELFVVAVYRG